jgi:LEA14-like dessication related protein
MIASRDWCQEAIKIMIGIGLATGRPPMPRLLLALLLLVVAACEGVGTGLEPPEVSIVNLRPGELGLFEQELIVDLRLTNPNNRAVRVNGVRFQLDVDDRPFGRGVATEGFTLPRLGDAVVPVSVRVGTAELIDRLMAFGTDPRVPYRLRGDLLLAGLAGTELPFDRSGTLRFPTLPLPGS